METYHDLWGQTYACFCLAISGRFVRVFAFGLPVLAHFAADTVACFSTQLRNNPKTLPSHRF
eukprot:3193432-Amphidinium_carterae.1